MADTCNMLWQILTRNEADDYPSWTRRDGNALSWPHGPRTITKKRWELLYWPDGETKDAAYEYDTLDNAIAALNKRPGDEGLTFTTNVCHTKALWYGLRAGRCPKKLLPLVKRVWLRPSTTDQAKDQPKGPGLNPRVGLPLRKTPGRAQRATTVAAHKRRVARPIFTPRS